MPKNASSSRPIIGSSTAIQKMLNLIERVAASKTNVLIIGESGTGKELVARMIHESGPLKEGPFVTINCGAIPENLIESEMFGHKRGSFTGAVNEKMGLFEVANGGTLFLDEVGELPLSMQVKLLRAIQERLIKKVGGTEDIRVDVRIIAATNRDLEEAVAQGGFREDLYYRLNVILIKTPPLREREGDVRILADYFVKKASTKYGKPPLLIEPDVLNVLEKYHWPGNVRELENVVERAIALQGEGRISLNSLPPSIQADVQISAVSASESVLLPLPDFTKGPVLLEDVLRQVEKTYILAALKYTQGVEKKAATLLGLSLRAIRDKMKTVLDNEKKGEA